MSDTEMLQALNEVLGMDFDCSGPWKDTDNDSYLEVTYAGNEYSTQIKTDGIRGYDCELYSPHGKTEQVRYENIGELFAALTEQSEIDDDFTRDNFIGQVNREFNDQIWKLNRFPELEDVVADWSPTDWDEDRYRRKIIALGIERINLDIHGNIIDVELIAHGDIGGDEKETFSGSGMARDCAQWFDRMLWRYNTDWDEDEE